MIHTGNAPSGGQPPSNSRKADWNEVYKRIEAIERELKALSEYVKFSKEEVKAL